MQTIHIYKLPTQHYQEIKPAPKQRNWMNQHPHSYTCLPMQIANQNGWTVHAPHDIHIQWNGNPNQEDLTITSPQPQTWAQSTFGQGILTFIPDFIIRTPPQVNLLVRGAPNHHKHNIHPLEGLVETDWLNYPFTMNWKMTNPGQTTFQKGEPIMYLQPTPHNYTENFQPELLEIQDNPQLQQAYNHYNNQRQQLINNQTTEKGHYTKGIDPHTNKKVCPHQHATHLNIQPPKIK